MKPAVQSMNACLPCRKVKMKCRSGIDGTEQKCERCLRKSLDCVFQEHRRGRKPGTRVSKGSASQARPADALSRPKAGDSEATGLSMGAHTPASQVHEVVPTVERNNLQPSGLLNREAMVGKFSLRCILSTGDVDVAEHQDDQSPIPTDDPSRLGLVNLSIARSLFENFMTVLNPYICQLDPFLHTFPYVRQKSPLLFSAMLAMAAKAFNTTTYAQLADHAQDLLSKSFRRGTKSTETAQAILILTYWKEPQDTRAWTLLGYAIRMCMDLGWHKLESPLVGGHDAMSDTERREARNVERTWYVMFVYDRSMSLQTGKPYMIERNGFIESIETWCNNSMSIPIDCLLGALVKLRLETSVVFDLLAPRQRRSEAVPLHNVEPLLSLIHVRIYEWESRWIRATEAADLTEEESCHQFLIRFYGTHLRLQLSLLPLQDIITSCGSEPPPSLEMLWVAYSSAMDMFQLVARHSSRLYFAQDSIHVMIAYGATFLIKLLLLAPHSMVTKIEFGTMNAIRAAELAFSQQAAPPGSSCALQARFLHKITSNVIARQSAEGQMNNSPDIVTVGHDAQLQAHALPEEAANLRDDSNHFVLDGSESIFQQGNLDYQFADDGTWENIFASAGFSTQDGVFLA